MDVVHAVAGRRFSGDQRLVAAEELVQDARALLGRALGRTGRWRMSARDQDRSVGMYSRAKRAASPVLGEGLGVGAHEVAFIDMLEAQARRDRPGSMVSRSGAVNCSDVR